MHPVHRAAGAQGVVGKPPVTPVYPEPGGVAVVGHAEVTTIGLACHGAELIVQLAARARGQQVKLGQTLAGGDGTPRAR